MPDLSMKAWLGRLDCDAPDHVKNDPSACDFEADFETRQEIFDTARRAGWSFTRDGRCICPGCNPKATPEQKVGWR